jgi:hypothetical protein
MSPRPGDPNFPGQGNDQGINPQNLPGGPPQINNPNVPNIQNPGMNPPMGRFQQPVFEQVWTCSRCGATIGRGAERPSVYTCPSCGARLSGPWTLVGTIIGGVLVGLFFLFKMLFNR